MIGVARQAASLDAIAAAGGEPLRMDLDRDSLDVLPSAGALVFHFAPPPGEGREDPRTARLVAHFARHGNPRRVVYISTTGVYGDCQGAWVDESWPVQPSAERSARRADAERRLQDWAATTGADLVILRVAGIYAADRLPLERLRQGLPVVKLEQAPWSNRIHAEDLVAICLAAAERAPAAAIYNVCDGHPSTMTHYFLEVARAAGLPPPPQIDLQDAPGQLSPGMLSYMSESRRLHNRRLREELGIRLRYPDLSAGLSASLSVGLAEVRDAAAG
jgi:nucleoside-diphosphate-sugar epimerase